MLRVTLEDVRRALRHNTYFQRKLVSASSALSALRCEFCLAVFSGKWVLIESHTYKASSPKRKSS